MRMGKAAKNRFFSWLLLIPSLSFICFLSFGFSFFLVTLPILFLSTIFLLTFTKKNMGLDENAAGNPLSSQEILKEDQKVGEEIHQVVGKDEEWSKLQPILENVVQNETGQHSEKGVIHDYQELQDIPIDSEGSDDSVPSEIFELKWTSPSNVEGQNLVVSDSSVSEEDDDDDDSLIEISLPGSESSGIKEDPNQNLQPKLPELLPESIFREQGFRELIEEMNEMNEEENLIEIDISMGSIKCSMYEIEA